MIVSMTTSSKVPHLSVMPGLETPPSDLLALPTGTVTFLLTDVENSTRMWEAGTDVASIAIARQYELLHAAITLHGGVLPLEQGEGDSVVAAFTHASAALSAALDAQRAFADEPWPSAATAEGQDRAAHRRGAAPRRAELLRLRHRALRPVAVHRSRRPDARVPGHP